jgi:hypothetical protein
MRIRHMSYFCAAVSLVAAPAVYAGNENEHALTAVTHVTLSELRPIFTQFTSVRILGKNGVIVTEAFLRESGLPAEGFWKPSRSELKEVERALPTFQRMQTRNRPTIKELVELTALVPKSRRQYVGMILDGRKVIWVNAIPQKPRKEIDPFVNWKREIIDVSDGGSKFWGVVYDVEKHSFVKLILNGSA